MNRFRARGSAATVVALVALLISAVVPATVAAAAPPVTLSVFMSDKCLSGQASAQADIEITWKDAYSNLKVHTYVTSDTQGRFSYCAPPGWVHVWMGDWISAKDLDTGVSHLLVVPRLTGFGNRDRDLYKGT